MAGALKPRLEDPATESGAAAALDREWAPTVRAGEQWDFPPETVSSSGVRYEEYRLSIAQGVVVFTDPRMASSLSMVPLAPTRSRVLSGDNRTGIRAENDQIQSVTRIAVCFRTHVISSS